MKKKTIKQKNKTSKVKYKSVLKVTDIYGAELWYKGDKLHRADGPALIWPDGTKEWYKEGKLHREDGPAAIYPDGRQYWYKEGKRHRDDGPAIICADGKEFWYKDGVKYNPPTPAKAAPEIKNTNPVSYIHNVPEAKGTSEFDKGWNAALSAVRSLYK